MYFSKNLGFHYPKVRVPASGGWLTSTGTHMFRNPIYWDLSDLSRSFQMLKRENNGKLPHLFIPSKSAVLVLEFAVEDPPSAERQSWFLRLQWRACPWVEHSDERYIYIYNQIALWINGLNTKFHSLLFSSPKGANEIITQRNETNFYLIYITLTYGHLIVKSKNFNFFHLK